MSVSRREAVRRMGAVVLMLGTADIALGASIIAVRVWPAEDYTRLTIESDEPLVARHQLVQGPDRLVVDIDGLELSPELRDLVGKVRPDDPFIAGVRIGQNQPRVVRLVIDLKQATAPQQFALAPVAAYRNRLVFDLYPTEQRDPLLALIEDKQQADKAAQSVQDALDDFIGHMDAKPAAPSLPPPRTAAVVGGLAQAGGSPQTGPLHAPERSPETVTANAGRGGAPAPAMAPSSSPPTRTAQLPPAKAPGSSMAAVSPGLMDRVDRLIVVAIDPGHGGEDPGASGPSGLHEKDVVLKIALKLRDMLNAQRGMRAMLTRDDDFFVPLQDRVRKARRVQADLFVSIHADAFITPEARGASVFALSENGATSSAARWMANKENAADIVGGVNVKTTDASVMRAMLDMSTTAQIKDSLQLGNEVLGQIGRVGKLHKGSVEQAGFAVLKAPDIPSILVETAFISNPEEEAKLRDEGYQDKVVVAVATGIQRYFAKNPHLVRNRTL